MSLPLGLTYISDVKPFKTNWRVRVKILHLWRQTKHNVGSKMQVTLRKYYIGKFHRSMKVGDWRIIDNFTLSPSTGKYKISSLSNRMGFNHNTDVSQCDPVLNSVFLDLADFEGIKNESYDENVLIDILGQVVSVGKVDEIVAQNKPNKKLEFQIRDARQVFNIVIHNFDS
ncbi:putative nucleic acid-binding protein [Arabidopsis thaliana]